MDVETLAKLILCIVKNSNRSMGSDEIKTEVYMRLGPIPGDAIRSALQKLVERGILVEENSLYRYNLQPGSG